MNRLSAYNGLFIRNRSFVRNLDVPQVHENHDRDDNFLQQGYNVNVGELQAVAAIPQISTSDPTNHEPESIDIDQNDLDENDVILIIAKVFDDCNLSYTNTKKIYSLLKTCINLKQDLPSFSVFKATSDNFSTITAYSRHYCLNHNTVVDEDDVCCDRKHFGEIAVFNLIDSVQHCLENNFEYLNMNSATDHSLEQDLARFTSSAVYESIWCDIEPDSDVIRITLLMNVDDAQMMKSTKITATPLSFTVAELPLHRRIAQENVYNLGIFWGKGKIDPNILWRNVLLDQLVALNMITDNDNAYQLPTYSSNPVVIETQFGNVQVLIRVGLVVMDSVAKHKNLNVKMFNGQYGCVYCCAQGKTVETTRKSGRKKGHAFVYPYKKDHEYVLKDHAFYLRYSMRAEERNVPVYGIKGSTILAKLIQVPLQTPIDYMHAILEGTFKHMITQHPFSKPQVLDMMDRFVHKVKMPHDFKRKFRSTREIAYWKAYEAKIFLLYMIPILRSYVPVDHFTLMIILCIITRILTSFEISEHDLNESHKLIHLFLRGFQDLYGESKMRYNLHLLLHMPKQVREIGSLTESSVFTFENNIFNLKKSFHGTTGQLESMVKKYIMKKSLYGARRDLQTILETYDPTNSLKMKSKHDLGQTNVYSEDKNYDMNSFSSILQSCFDAHSIENCNVFHRVRVRRDFFHSRNYNLRKSSCSYAVSFLNSSNTKNFGLIECFFQIDSIQSNKITYCIINILSEFSTLGLITSINQPRLTYLRDEIVTRNMKKYFKRVKITNRFKIIQVSTICNKILMIPCSGINGRMVNHIQ